MTAPEHRSSVTRRRFDLTVTLIAAGAALLGSLVGGGLSYLSTHQQIKAESSNSQRDFLRNQRQLVYSKLLSDDQLYSSMEEDKSFTFAEKPTRAQAFAKLDELATMSSAMHKTLLTDFASIELVASNEVVVAALALIDNHLGVMAALQAHGACQMPDAKVECSKAQSDFNDSYNQEILKQTLFVGPARVDVSSS
jgi:hypothetical protein